MRRVSVIIPVYNGEAHIENIFNFLSEQTYRDFETIFVVDRKSTDGTIEEIERCAAGSTDVLILEQSDDGGLGGARNLGIEKASGEIIWFLDVDDRPLPDFLSDLVDIMDREGADVVVCNHIRSSTLYPKLSLEGSHTVQVMNRDEALKARLQERIPVTAWSKIISKKLIDEAGLRFTHDYGEDIEYTYHVFSNSKKICYFERPLYVYLQHPESLCNKGDKDNARGWAEIRAYDRLEEKFQKDDFFRRGSSLIRLRSAAHMDKKEFMKYAKSEECRKMIDRNLRDPVSPEAVFFLLFPSLYYRIIRIILNLVFYREGRLYTSCQKWRGRRRRSDGTVRRG